MNVLLPRGLDDGLHALRLADGRVAIAKIRRRAPSDFFHAEARGLAALRASDTLRVPEVFEIGADGILLEDLGNGRANHADWQRAGTQLAKLHERTAPLFGFPTPGWCGNSVQDNTPCSDGYDFFTQRRLLHPSRQAYARGRLDSGDMHRIERIAAHLADWLAPMPAVLVHGDLWLGNLHACANGELALIDAGAVHHGWAETDLAMLTLFGTPPREFFDAYEARAGVDAGWRERAPLYNLYHLLNHLNLFGAAYVGSVRNVLARYG